MRKPQKKTWSTRKWKNRVKIATWKISFSHTCLPVDDVEEASGGAGWGRGAMIINTKEAIKTNLLWTTIYTRLGVWAEREKIKIHAPIVGRGSRNASNRHRVVEGPSVNNSCLSLHLSERSASLCSGRSHDARSLGRRTTRTKTKQSTKRKRCGEEYKNAFALSNSWER